jgi:hypothetical protein
MPVSLSPNDILSATLLLSATPERLVPAPALWLSNNQGAMADCLRGRAPAGASVRAAATQAAFAMKEDRERFLSAGVDRYLAKQIDNLRTFREQVDAPSHADSGRRAAGGFAE